MADEGSKGAYGQFLVLRDRKIHPDARFHHHQMAPHLPYFVPPGLFKGPGRFPAGNIGKPRHSLNGNQNFRLIATRRNGRSGLLILGPQPGSDRFLDVDQSFLLVLPLGHTPGQGRALSNDPAVFGRYRATDYHLSPQKGFEYLKESIDAQMEWSQHEASMMQIGIHPFESCYPDRLLTFDRTFAYLRSLKGVWFCTYKELAEYWIKTYLS